MIPNFLLRLTYSLVAVLFTMTLYAQEYRPIDGADNNLDNPQWGAKGTEIIRIAPVAYEDSISTPAAPNRANPRTISNEMCAQNENIASKHKYSDFVWVFGQFIDHDVTLIFPDANQPYPIEVPVCDEMFDPNCDGYGTIPLNRSAYKQGTGTSVENPRVYLNQITSWIDGSNIYGSDQERAQWLRTFEGGKLKTSENDLMPFNTYSGEYNDNLDPESPHMDNANRYTTRVYVAGDVRANENVNLSVMHTLFMREHNRWCDVLAQDNPSWNDEKLYQEARKRVIAELQAITYEEWLPAIGIDLPEYEYDSKVNPGISLTFSAAAYRMGHTLVNSRIIRMDDQCNPVEGGDMTLKNAFFNPRLLDAENSIDPFIKGMSYQIQQEMDCQLQPDIRNFLFGPPEAGIGMDLAAINIQRAREEGLPDYNTIRESYGLERVSTFQEICSDPNVYIPLQELYEDVNNIDAWVGMLAEEHVEGAMFGPTVLEVLRVQFEALKDGDRYYYENDPGFSIDEIQELKETTLRDIIMNNTSLQLMQENVFKAEPKCVFEGIDLSSSDLNMYAYPNPTPDYYNLGIYAFEDAEAEYYIVDQTGRVVQEQVLKLTEGMNTYSMSLNSNFSSGVYTLVIKKGLKKRSIKLQKI